MKFYIHKNDFERFQKDGKIYIQDWILNSTSVYQKDPNFYEVEIEKIGDSVLWLYTDDIRFSTSELIEEINYKDKKLYIGFSSLEDSGLISVYLSSKLTEEFKDSVTFDKLTVLEWLIKKYLKEIECIDTYCIDINLENDSYEIDCWDCEYYGDCLDGYEGIIDELPPPSYYKSKVEKYVTDFVNFAIEYRKLRPKSSIDEIIDSYAWCIECDEMPNLGILLFAALLVITLLLI